MAHHAFFYAGNLEEGIKASYAYANEVLEIPAHGNPDVIAIRYGLFSVEDARKLTELAYQSPVNGSVKVLILATGRLFHEAQNALLKLFEEPPQGTVLILVVPSEGILLETLRSRLLPLPGSEQSEGSLSIVSAFLKLSQPEREQYVAKLVDRTKADRPETERQNARLESLALAEGLERIAYQKRADGDESEDLLLFIQDLERFIPILHDRSAPLKLIFEHLLLVLPHMNTRNI